MINKNQAICNVLIESLRLQFEKLAKINKKIDALELQLHQGPDSEKEGEVFVEQ